MLAPLWAFFNWLLQLGSGGLVLMGVLDSSFLFIPFGNDVLLALLSSAHHEHLVVYVVAAAAGSTLGVLLLDSVCRSKGEDGLKHLLGDRRFEFVKRRLHPRAGIALTLAALTPPPFPFSVVVATVSAFQYSKSRLLGLIFAGRLVRFTIIAWAAVRWGRHLAGMQKSSTLKWTVVGFALICVIGSVASIRRWIQMSKFRTAATS